MEKISLLVFSRNDTEKAINVIKGLYNFVDEVVLVDCSDSEYRAIIYKNKKNLGLSRLRVFHTVAVGDSSPFKTYALRRCKYDWVLQLDTDEDVNHEFKKDLRRIIGRAKCSAFFIKRFEEVTQDKDSNVFSRQIRLYKRKDIEFSGIFHRLPVVYGKIETLPDKYYMNHMSEFKTRKRLHREFKFERFSYSTFNNNLENYLLNPNFPKGVIKKAVATSILSAIRLGERIRAKDMNGEISNFDYFLFFIIITGGYAFMGRDSYRILHLFPEGLAYVTKINRWKQDPDSKEIFEIAKIIDRIGIIKYLGLDKDKTVEMVNRKYARSEQGIALLTRLLKERYENGKNYAK